MAYAKYQQPEAKYTVAQVVAAAIYLEEMQSEVRSSVIEVLDSNIPLPEARAERMIEEVQQSLTMKILRGGNLSEFTRKLTELLRDPNKKIARDFNLLGYTPNVHKGLVKENQLVQTTSGSTYQGEWGKPITKTVKVLRCKYVPAYNFYTALLIDLEGNVYSYSPKADLEEGKTITIKGKVKAHKQDKYNNNCATTYLNYVKVLEE